MKNVIKHFVTITKHKIAVMKNCFKAGLYWQGIVHDLSKYSPTEFFESVKYYQGTRSPIDACKEVKGYSEAWLHHKGRNKHHYEYWQDGFDKGTIHLQMPFKYALELVCDYLAAGQVYMGKNFTYQAELEWWHGKLQNNIAMDPKTKAFVTTMLETMAADNNCNVLQKDIAKRIWNATEV